MKNSCRASASNALISIGGMKTNVVNVDNSIRIRKSNVRQSPSSSGVCTPVDSSILVQVVRCGGQQELRIRWAYCQTVDKEPIVVWLQRRNRRIQSRRVCAAICWLKYTVTLKFHTSSCL